MAHLPCKVDAIEVREMTILAIFAVAYFCGMVDVSHRDPLPYGLIVAALIAVAITYKFGVTV